MLVPNHGYSPEDKQSSSALAWLSWMEKELKLSIQHALSGGEVKVDKFKLDGLCTEGDKQRAFEFHGCFWHGCPKCFSRETVNPTAKKSMAELYDETQHKRRVLQDKGFSVTEIWECEWKEQISERPDLASFVESFDRFAPLNPREAFMGGRTETFKLYQDSSDCTIDYVDYTSLYPYINKYGKYPIGHPDRIFRDFKDISEYEGLIKCKIVPPWRLRIPVLPQRINNKLMFVLCHTCASNESDNCNHSDEERSLTGTWTTDEVKKAIEKGYHVLKIYEIWHFTETARYDKGTGSGGLFSGYIDCFMKLKQEASGWPSNVNTEQEKQQYIDSYLANEGIQLEYERIEKNPGLRSLAKLMLNSFWGKFGQRSNMTQLEHISEPAEYFDLLTSESQEVTDVNFINTEMVEMRWKYFDDFIQSNPRTNVIIAAYTTSQARLKLYDDLDRLQERALYVDTDSIIYLTQNDDPMLKTGDYLGELTNEVPEGRITNFVSAGPKNYALKIVQGNKTSTLVKVRGITLNYNTALQIDFNTVKEIIDFPKMTVATKHNKAI